MPAPVSRYRRVRIPAWDCLTAAGDAAAAWAACRDGRSALRRVEGLGWCGTITDVPGAGVDALALAAARAPWRALDMDGVIAIAACASKGDPAALDAALRGDAASLLRAGAERPTAVLARALGLRFYLPAPVAAACSTGLYGVLGCADLVESGAARAALAGASDASLTPLLVAGFAALGVLCGETRPTAFAAPTGFAPAEGAGFVALGGDGPWRLAAGVRVADARHETQFIDPSTLHAAFAALWEVGPRPDLIVVHGTGTAAGDAYELAGLDGGPWRDRPRLVCKPVIGHCLGASGAAELALALEAPVACLWKLSLGFGGHLAAVVCVRD